MFVLDTNILSAMMSTQAAPQVAAWIAGQPADLLFTTSVSQAETRGDSSQVRAAPENRQLPSWHRASPPTMCQLHRVSGSGASGNW